MTDDEDLLYFIARDIVLMNPNAKLLLTGSLMLALSGIKKRREAHDIDFICDQSPGDLDIIMPIGYFLEDDGRYESTTSRFYNEEKDVYVDFIYTEDLNFGGMIDGIACGTFADLVSAKINYALKNKDSSATKHLKDVEYIAKHMKLNFQEFTAFYTK